ncbi:NACHT domain-containing protein [Actinoplanes sp. NPDC000266]
MSGRRLWWAVVAGAVMLLWALHPWDMVDWKFGDVDPVGLIFGSATLVLALTLAIRDRRRNQVDLTMLADRLAQAVLTQEQAARRQLLGDPERVIDVRFSYTPPRPARRKSGRTARSGQLSDIATSFRQLPTGRMVITGAPGAGKTLLAIEFIMMVLKNREPSAAVPVRMPATSWNVDGHEVRRHLIEYLVAVYDFPARSAEALVDAGLVLLIVDGLDELDGTDQPGYASRAGLAVRALNGYQRFNAGAPVIVTCRSSQYQALIDDHNALTGAARVEILPLTGRQARDFISDRTMAPHRWQGVLDRLDADPRGRLAAGLATPWRLTLATAVYEQRDPDGSWPHDPAELTDPALDTAEKVRDHLLTLFLPTALQTVGPRAHQWLAVLAGFLADNNRDGRSLGGRRLSGTDITLHELWPLAGTWLPRSVLAALIAASWAVALPTMVAHAHADRAQYLTAIVVIQVSGSAWAIFLPWVAVRGSPRRLRAVRVRSRSGRRRLSSGLLSGIKAGSVGGFGCGLVGAVAAGYGGSVNGLVMGASVGALLGAAAGMPIGVVAVGLGDDNDITAANPRSVLRGDLVFGLVAGLTNGLLAGFCAALVSRPPGAVAIAFAATVTFFGQCGFASSRYAALLLCTRRWNRHHLPLRLEQFLDQCRRAGLLRVAGVSYQFRHRELQDHLAAHPVPALPPAPESVKVAS